jgi:hypothetical protein
MVHFTKHAADISFTATGMSRDITDKKQDEGRNHNPHLNPPLPSETRGRVK